jgi:hypothetical protein
VWGSGKNGFPRTFFLLSGILAVEGCKLFLIRHMGHFPEPQHKKAASDGNGDFVLALISKPLIRIS